MESLLRLKNKKQIVQKSNKWYEARYNLLTASTIASILGKNPYKSKLQLLEEKCKPFDENNSFENDATKWGNKYEDVVRKIYENMMHDKVEEVGLFIHDKYDFIGASPDGICESGKLLEIKCVWNRNVHSEIPIYYLLQCQLQMEVCDVDKCDLFQCKIVEYKNRKEYLDDVLPNGCAFMKGGIYYEGKKYYWKLEKYSLKTIERDKKWFQESLPKFKEFWNKVIYYRKYPNQFKNDINNLKNYSDNNDNNDNIITTIQRSSKRYKMDDTYVKEDWTKWFNARDVKNYMNDDCILDWLNMYGENEYTKYNKDVTNDFNEYLTKKNKDYVFDIMELIKLNFIENDIIKIADINEKYSVDKFQETFNQMKLGKPIIINGLLHNNNENIYGIPDLIVRVDYLNIIMSMLGHDYYEQNNETNIQYDYRIIEINNVKLKLKDDRTIVNNNNIKSHKGGIVIMNEIMKNILGYVPNNIFIAGANKQIGIIDVVDYDRDIVHKSFEAIKWLKDLKMYGKNWDIYNPHRRELYPNMCNKDNDYPWHQIKKNIAYKIGEITLLPNCGVKEREKCHTSGVYKWEQVFPELIDFKGNRAEILNNVITVNTSNDNGTEIIFNPKNAKIVKKNKVTRFFIDFETISNLEDINDDGKTFIYMIGCGYINKKDKEWVFKTFITKRLTYDEEKRIIKEWINYMNKVSMLQNLNTNYELYHWSNAEITMSKVSFTRHNIKNKIEYKWIDLLKFFKDNAITIKDAFNYSVKTIAKSLYNYGYIETKWEDNTLDGTIAMLVAWDAEKICKKGDINELEEYDKMKSIIKYNEVDCKVLSEIFNLF